ncbi:13967_t:CDS:2, partial [Entrophospora sp. SA101]
LHADLLLSTYKLCFLFISAIELDGLDGKELSVYKAPKEFAQYKYVRHFMSHLVLKLKVHYAYWSPFYLVYFTKVINPIAQSMYKFQQIRTEQQQREKIETEKRLKPNVNSLCKKVLSWNLEAFGASCQIQIRVDEMDENDLFMFIIDSNIMVHEFKEIYVTVPASPSLNELTWVIKNVYGDKITLSTYLANNPKEIQHELKSSSRWKAIKLMSSQAEAIWKVINQKKGFTLIQGSPGTGKTSTIVSIVSELKNVSEHIKSHFLVNINNHFSDT